MKPAGVPCWGVACGRAGVVKWHSPGPVGVVQAVACRLNGSKKENKNGIKEVSSECGVCGRAVKRIGLKLW